MRVLLVFVSALILGCFASSFALQSSSADDDRIHDEVIRKLAMDRDIKGNTFDVEVKAGVVTVSGIVEKEGHRKKAEKLIRKVKGVKDVVNKLIVKVT